MLTAVGVGVVATEATVVITGDAPTVVLSVVAGRGWVNMEPGVSDTGACDVAGWVWAAESGGVSEVGIAMGAGASGAVSVEV